MKGRAKVLDSRFMEFIEYLQKMGELQNMVRMIDSFAEMRDREYDVPNIESNQVNNNGIDLLFPFWRNGWIEIREIDKRRKDWHIKEYTLRVRLDEIAAYFEQENPQQFNSSVYTICKRNAQIHA